MASLHPISSRAGTVMGCSAAAVLPGSMGLPPNYSSSSNHQHLTHKRRHVHRAATSNGLKSFFPQPNDTPPQFPGNPLPREIIPTSRAYFHSSLLSERQSLAIHNREQSPPIVAENTSRHQRTIQEKSSTSSNFFQRLRGSFLSSRDSSPDGAEPTVRRSPHVVHDTPRRTMVSPMPSLRTPHSFQSSHSWTQAVSGAERLVHPKGGSVINPRELLGQDLTVITEHIRRLLGSGHPVLNTISAYYFQQQGKHIRPLIVLLMSMAANVTAQTQSAAKGVVPASREDIDRAIGDSEIVFRDFMKDSSAVSPSYPSSDLPILDSQRRLAEITEMIHTASLLHDDVIDESPTRRNNPSAHAAFGNKMAILAGDFLLARASVALARLRNVEVVELLATVISNLVEGEFMQLRNSQAADADVKPSVAARVAALMVGGSSESEPSVKMTKFEYYLEKTYLKTASLIAKSCRAAAVLGGGAEEVTQIAYDYGKNLGLAFQIVDDMLDFVSTAEELGKPAAADLNLGLATAPVLYAAEEYPEMNELIERKFNQPGDVEQALDLVRRSDGVKATMDLAVSYCQRAIDEIAKLPESPARNALIDLTYTVVNRKK